MSLSFNLTSILIEISLPIACEQDDALHCDILSITGNNKKTQRQEEKAIRRIVAYKEES